MVVMRDGDELELKEWMKERRWEKTGKEWEKITH